MHVDFLYTSGKTVHPFSIPQHSGLHTKHALSSLQVYSGVWRERPVVIKCGVEDPVQSNGAPQSVRPQDNRLYDKPTRGTSMDEFKEMVHIFLKVYFL